MTLPVAILAGGMATRLGPLTEKLPKSLIEVAGRPFAEHQVELLARAGVARIVFCVGYLGEMLEDRLGDGGRWGVEIRYSHDGPKLLGTGGALRRALPLLGEAFLVLYGDAYLECDYAAVEAAFRASGARGLMTILRNEGRWDRSNVVFRGGRIVRYDKRQPSDEMQYIDYGLGALRSAALDSIPQDEPFELADVYQRLVAADQLTAFVVTKRFYEIGSPAGLVETEEHLRNIAVGRGA